MGSRRSSSMELAIVVIIVSITLLCFFNPRRRQLRILDQNKKILQKNYDDLYSEMRNEELRDMQKIEEIKKEHIYKHKKAHENRWKNESMKIAVFDDDGKDRHQLNTRGPVTDDECYEYKLKIAKVVFLKDANNSAWNLAHSVFPNAAIMPPDFEWERRHDHKMMPYMIRKKNVIKSNINLN